MASTADSNSPLANGDRRIVDGIESVYYDGYWIRYYAPLEDTLANRKRLIDSLTRRAFHHTEAGINTPGKSLELAREAYESETDSARKRVNAAMLAGALFNRATDLFTSIVDLGELGVQVSHSNELMRECSDCFQEALTLGKQVKHHSGDEGIDEVWGEPFKAFTMPVADFYQSRFIKIAQSMRDIDSVASCMIDVFCNRAVFADIHDPIVDYAAAARQTAETMKKDPIIFQVWPNFVALGETIDSFKPALPEDADQMLRMRVAYGRDLIQEGRRLISYIASARVPMPKSSKAYMDKCHRYNRALLP
ncbi:MAG: hypothetical protein OEN02_02355 [Gammaproteobacteria bacterium]|nr:hypothetical protein [Gammaproteobacteria bacterium]MDH3534316.1 hypothetical protein [Gammaproteobacteria bacterium]